MPLPNILQPKWKLFVKHHERLRHAPDPARAQAKFDHRIHRCQRVGLVRMLFFAGLYFSFIATVLSFFADRFDIGAAGVLTLTKTVLSSLTVVFLAGIFVCNRYLGYLEVELYYYSAETRHPAPTA